MLIQRRDLRHPRDQGRQEADHSDIGQQEIEGTVRMGEIERRRRGAEVVRGAEQHAQLIRDFERPGRRLHGMPVAHEQGIAELGAEMSQHLADTGLGRCQQGRRPGDAPLME